MTKPYPGIPAGVLDEDLEEHMSEMKFKGCPFCGGGAEMVRQVTEALTVFYFVRCLDCGATGSIEGTEPDNPVAGITQASVMWNRRHT